MNRLLVVLVSLGAVGCAQPKSYYDTISCYPDWRTERSELPIQLAPPSLPGIEGSSYSVSWNGEVVSGAEVQILAFDFLDEPSLVTTRCPDTFQFIEWNTRLRFQINGASYTQDKPMLIGLENSGGFVEPGGLWLFALPGQGTPLNSAALQQFTGPWEDEPIVGMSMSGFYQEEDSVELELILYASGRDEYLEMNPSD